MEPSKVKRRLAAILMADVVEYSRLMGQDEEATAAALRDRRDVFTSQIHKFNGQVVEIRLHSAIETFS